MIGREHKITSFREGFHLTDLSFHKFLVKADEGQNRGTILIVLGLVILLAFLPTALVLNAGPWQTEQEGHGPFLIAAAAWFAMGKRQQLKSAQFSPAPILGWLSLLGGLMILYVGRSQEIISIETFSFLPIITGSVLLVGGWSIFRILAFPIFLLFFAVPPPAWLLDAVTLPLKAMISDGVTKLLYAAGYPIAQNGVVIMIGPYQLLVKDACAGMNSIFALSAIGIIYVYIMKYDSWLRNVALLLAILPITVAANFVRVVLLVLIAYHFGSDAVEGWVHDVTGVSLFAAAFAIIVIFDMLLGVPLSLIQRIRRTTPQPIDPGASPGAS
jgi:exosortase B